ncbi:unnamed protein product [Mytilus edulis]|uniref:Uncharacterized protein n=1 Tax=Mytilus edulis TaxID=6550 RepID=A0A8S3QQV6_MYTED|nr:unnamed protein product [Mytilus edulis]
MASIVVGSVNCRGLANKVKRLDIFSICKKRYDIAVLVDTHCCLENENKWLQEWGYTGKFSSYSNRSRGVAVLFKNSFEFKINNEIIDNNEKNIKQKNISKLLLEGNQVVQDQNAILREQTLFYETLNKSSNSRDEENATFMKENKPFLNKPGRED